MWKRAGGFRKNKLPSLTFNETPPRHCCDRGERKKKRRRNEQKARWRYQTRRNTYHWFHCWSPRLPLSKCRTSEEDKTRHRGGVSGEEEFLHHKQNDSVANLLKDFMISSVNYVTVVPLCFFYWPCKLTRRRFTRSPFYWECCSSWAHLSVRSEGWNVFFLKCHKWYICNAYEKKRD